MLRRVKWFLLLACLWLSACNAAVPPTPTATELETPQPSLTPLPLPAATSFAHSCRNRHVHPHATATPDPYEDVTIAGLRSRSYGGGEVEIVQRYGKNNAFTRYEIRYPSDGLNINGFMDVPNGSGPFPVIILLHGYLEPARYNTLDYSTPYADSLAQAGYLVLHPNLRGYTPSDDGPNRFRVGYAVDVLNLIALLKDQAGKPGPLELADASRLGLWGHSMGGGIAIRVMVVSPDVDAVVLYGSMSADDLLNYERLNTFFSNGEWGVEELQASPQDFLRISPVNFLPDVAAAVSIHHGSADQAVPPEWSEQFMRLAKAAGQGCGMFQLSRPTAHLYRSQRRTFPPARTGVLRPDA